MKNIFLTLTGYQITWLCCVFGEYYNFSFLGLIVGIFYLCIFFYFIDFKIRALIICFIFGAIFTPPDVISQFMLAVPMYVLFELGLLFSYEKKT